MLDALRADPATQDLRVVILSASAMPESVSEALRHGARDYWTKPIDFDRFLRGMREQLAGAAAEPALRGNHRGPPEPPA